MNRAIIPLCMNPIKCFHAGQGYTGAVEQDPVRPVRAGASM